MNIDYDVIKDYFIRINNKRNFVMGDIPQYHPKSIKYIQFWRNQKKRCIEGLWSIDDSNIDLHDDEYQIINNDPNDNDYLLSKYNKWRYMPSNLYFYINFGTILKDDPDPNASKTAPKKKGRPQLTDVEWEFFYYWTEGRGFSGFIDDNKYSCNRDIPLFLKGDLTSVNDPSAFDKQGNIKTYVPAREYLRSLFDKPLGRALFKNTARNLFMLGARGFGKSYMVGVGIVLHEFLFDGLREYKVGQKIENSVEIFVGAAMASKSAEILNKTKLALNNLPGEFGIGTDEYKPSPFFKQHKGTLSVNNMKNAFRHHYDKKIGGIMHEDLGTGASIKHGVYTIENPEAAAGTRPGVMVVEEVGLLPNLLLVHGSNTACQINDNNEKTGSSVYLGTGGNVEKIQEGEKIFRNPEGYDFLGIPNIWENPSKKIGWFVPAYYGMRAEKDENGNTILKSAIEKCLLKRKRKASAGDPSALALEMMNHPLVPSEMFLKARNALFPQVMIKEQIAEIESTPHKYHNASYFGEIVRTGSGILKWVTTDDSQLVTKFPIDNNQEKAGVIQIWEMPKKDGRGQVFRNRYAQGTDTYDDDSSITSSVGSTFVFDLWTDRIVAEFTGRPKRANHFYDICMKLNEFYGCEHNYENNKKGLYSYYFNKNKVYLLCDTPQYLKDVEDITIHKAGNKSKGTHASKAINAHGIRSQLDWMLEPAYGEDPDSGILNLHKIKSVGYLKECLNFDNENNFDRISAMNMVCILRNAKLKYVEKAQEVKVKRLSEDPFFTRNYDAKINNRYV